MLWARGSPLAPQLLAGDESKAEGHHAGCRGCTNLVRSSKDSRDTKELQLLSRFKNQDNHIEKHKGEQVGGK